MATFDIEMIKAVYATLQEKVDAARRVLGRPLTLTEKILLSHLAPGVQIQDFVKEKDYVDFSPDRVAMQDATAQMALLQFMQAGVQHVAVPSSVHCDHLIEAVINAAADIQVATITNEEVYNLLRQVANKYGIGFWGPNSGIIHQVVLENYAFPGGMMIGTDSHTVNAGGLGMLAIGVGGADACDVMVGLPWELAYPKLIGIKLTGKLHDWASAKDVILKVAGILTTKGGTNAVVEYFGPGAETISCTGKGTICNMGAEIGATTSTFGYDATMEYYLRATHRHDVADAANAVKQYLTGDPEVYANPELYFDQVIEIDLSTLVPHLNGPFTPDLATPVNEMKIAAAKNDWPTKVIRSLIGSCTNSSIQDISIAASIAQFALDNNIKLAVKELMISPGSQKVLETAEKMGFLVPLRAIGAVIYANACGPCIGMWNRPEMEMEERNTIVHTFNRNFSKRADGSENTLAFVGSPAMIMAIALSGKLDFDPLTDTIKNEHGEDIMLDIPHGIALPSNGFSTSLAGYIEPAEDGSDIEIIVDPQSERLQLLDQFPAWSGDNIFNAKVLIKVEGKCTTDHISPAGKWLKFRGHLDNISDNMLTGAINAFNGEKNLVLNWLNGEYQPVPQVQRNYKERGIKSIIVGGENYGEGSSREHAAMEPRHLGVAAVLVKSFARIHETNLKKQGMLGLTFDNPLDYDKIQEEDTIDILGLSDMQPGQQIEIVLTHQDGQAETIWANHTYNDQQIAWFKAGGALNIIRTEAAAKAAAEEA